MARNTLDVIDEAFERVDGWGIWTRDGLNGLVIQINGKNILLEKEAVLRLFGEELIAREIAKLEQMKGEEAVYYLLRGGSGG